MTDIVLLEHLEYSIEFPILSRWVLQFVATRPKRAGRGVPKCANRVGRLLAGIDQLFVENSEYSVPGSEYFADRMHVFGRGLNDSSRGRIDYRSNSAGLGVQQIAFLGHIVFRSLCSSGGSNYKYR